MVTDDLRGEVEEQFLSFAKLDKELYRVVVRQVVELVQEKVAEERKARGHVAGCRCHAYMGVVGTVSYEDCTGPITPLIHEHPYPDPRCVDDPYHLNSRCAPPDKQGGERE